jgi:hypothetical protein
MDEIEADFIVFYRIYDIYDDDRLDGPRFLRLTNQLVMYEGALRRKLTVDVQETEGSGGNTSTATTNDSGFTPGQTMSMSEALARSKGDEMAVLESLSRDSQSAGLGDLFEYETA